MKMSQSPLPLRERTKVRGENKKTPDGPGAKTERISYVA